MSTPKVFHGKSDDMISFTVSAALQKLTQVKRRFILLLLMRIRFCHAFIAHMLCILQLRVSKDKFDYPNSNDVISLLVAAAIQEFPQFHRRFLLLLRLRRCFCLYFIAHTQSVLRLKVSTHRFHRAKSNDIIS